VPVVRPAAGRNHRDVTWVRLFRRERLARGTGGAGGASRSRPPCPGRPGWPRRWSIVVVATTTMGHRGGWRQPGAVRAHYRHRRPPV